MLGHQLVVLLRGGVHLGRKNQRCDFQGYGLSCPVCAHILSPSLPFSFPLAVTLLPSPVFCSLSLWLCVFLLISQPP